MVVGVPDLPHPESAIAPAASNGTDKIDIVDGFMVLSFSVRVISITGRELPQRLLRAREPGTGGE
jgi:hypothetical protein